ncbi:Actin-related protein 2/3 complex subunit 1A [Striga hermonthica]|uniref:Arp2/3 complex 41 kDa subunit n=1 Tax=Striga hermonthica TaxID=68872 RepID=A0A9N7NQB3_STRHE|nr:Actin-related protein 2/3 complex subunit 1A [Striga hermonthica]
MIVFAVLSPLLADPFSGTYGGSSPAEGIKTGDPNNQTAPELIFSSTQSYCYFTSCRRVYHVQNPAVISQFPAEIECHGRGFMIAFCPNNSEVHIYQLLGGKWEKIHVLQNHDQIVSGLHWGVSFNRIVTVAHDRNSYVWSKEASEWVPTLVILRLNRAALCVQWSPKENKFAAGSGAKTVCICYYEQENNWNSTGSSSSDSKFEEVLFVSERMLIGVGFDCNPMVFAADERGLWSFLRFLDETKPTPGAKYDSQRSGTFGKFSSQSKNGSSDENSETSRRHDKCITSIVALKDAGDTTITSFSTSGFDGKVIIWDLQREQDLLEYL